MTGNNNAKAWKILGVVVFLLAAFGGGYAFLTTNFVSRREFDEVKAEQARRTPIVHSSPVELSELKKRVERLENTVFGRRGGGGP